ncbi:50S ribosomal protein L33 [Lactobacillus sp. S2-2]|nr:50S ribosomal protein L33 [Lactobacillus sp. S2-2]MCF6515645.1 50S ribosomal protein L33 [Lactobacillus sp. S2-2]
MKSKVALECSNCGSRNYNVPANANSKQRLEIKKFCNKCGKQTLHRANP